jgi:hypothetical protein
MLLVLTNKKTTMKTLYFALLLGITGVINAQDIGKIVIRNANINNPRFIVSLNGIRQNNIYTPEISFDFLDDYSYRVKILQMGVNGALLYTIANTPNYVSVYALNKDAYGNYALILESKTLLANEPPPLPTQPVLPPVQPHNPPTTTPLPPRETNRINPQEFAGMSDAIKNESFESTKMEMAKTFFGNRELSSAQVLEVTKLFTMESNKLEFSKYAYSRTFDKKNYYKVYDAFTFSSSKKELSAYTKANP